ncbi:MAG TPA: PKD domain-containing protein [Polyangia bacterium]|nr:PKD domain-containing protein [Polyangia bacterium]
MKIGLAVLLLGWSAASCDSNHCGIAAATIDDAGTGSGVGDGAIERTSVTLPEAGAETSDSAGAQDVSVGVADAKGDGSISVMGTFNNCPNIVAATASPPQATVGEMISVAVTASDQDLGDHLTYAWTALGGSFPMPSAARTAYTCTEQGMWQLTVKVSDGQCTQTVTVMVSCGAAGAPG